VNARAPRTIAVRNAPAEPAPAVDVPEPLTEPRRDWDETPAAAGRADADYWVDRDWDGEYDDPSDHYYY
jgi:hypothetical protein